MLKFLVLGVCFLGLESRLLPKQLHCESLKGLSHESEDLPGPGEGAPSPQESAFNLDFK